MDTWLLLYLILKLSSVIALFGIGAVLMGITAFSYFIIGISTSKFDHDYNEEKYEGAKQYLFRRGRKFAYIAAALTFLATIIPSTRDVLFITGGVGVLEAARTERANEIASKSVLVIEKFLDNYLKETEKPTK